jgi:hypothetical protein
MLLKSPPYDVLQLIAAEVHYVDLVNLSLASKKIRATMFPGLEGSVEDRELRFYSCKGDEKSTCWTCGVQVCKVSQLLPFVYSTQVSSSRRTAGRIEQL